MVANVSAIIWLRKFIFWDDPKDAEMIDCIDRIAKKIKSHPGMNPGRPILLMGDLNLSIR